MPLRESDVLNTLGDFIAQAMKFRVGPVPIAGKSYDIIRDHVRDGNDRLATQGAQDPAEGDAGPGIVRSRRTAHSPTSVLVRRPVALRSRRR
jgi:hypothetical protein